jgi:ribosomal protein S18 acetylase RimI-like enzyme
MNNHPIQIRYAAAADAALLAELGAKTFYETFASENTPENMADYLASAFSPSKQAAELADPAGCFLIAESGGIPAGYARLRTGEAPPEIGDPGAIELQRIYVLRDWQGHKVGAALIQACLNEATAKGHATIWLGVWEHNPRAIAFYQKWGFEQVGAHVFQLGDDPQTDLVMRRSLAQQPADL